MSDAYDDPVPTCTTCMRDVPEGVVCVDCSGEAELRARVAQLESDLREAVDQRDRLQAELNTPHTADFLDAVRIEAAHQRQRWGVEHDAGKADADWFWLLGYLGGKALHPGIDAEKKLHRIIAAAAALLNWHAHASGTDTRMRPGIAPPATEAP